MRQFVGQHVLHEVQDAIGQYVIVPEGDLLTIPYQADLLPRRYPCKANDVSSSG